MVREALSAEIAASAGVFSMWQVRPKGYSPPFVDRIWGIWESYYNIPNAIFYLLTGDSGSASNPSSFSGSAFLFICLAADISVLSPLETALTRPIPRDPSIQIILTLGPKVCKYYLHWAIWIPRVYNPGP